MAKRRRKPPPGKFCLDQTKDHWIPYLSISALPENKSDRFTSKLNMTCRRGALTMPISCLSTSKLPPGVISANKNALSAHFFSKWRMDCSGLLRNALKNCWYLNEVRVRVKYESCSRPNYNNTGHAGHYGSKMPSYALPRTPSSALRALDGVLGSAYSGIIEPRESYPNLVWVRLPD